MTSLLYSPPYFEFFPTEVVVILGALLFAVVQLGPSNVGLARASTPRIHPLSIMAFTKGLSATLSAVLLTNKLDNRMGYGGASISATLFSGAFPLSYLSFLWLPRLFGLKPVTPKQIGMRMSDLLNSETVSSLPTMDSVCRLLLHPFCVFPYEFLTQVQSTFHSFDKDKGTTNFRATFYWIAFLPASFYLLFSLLDGGRDCGQFIGNHTTLPATTTTSDRPYTKLYRMLSNCGLVVITNLLCASVALHFYGVSPILPDPNVFYGPESLLVALFVLLMYENPIIFTTALRDRSVELPFVVEARWIYLSVIMLLVAVTPWKKVPLILLAGGLSGAVLVLQKWVKHQRQAASITTTTTTATTTTTSKASLYRKLKSLLLVLELSLYLFAFFFVSFPSKTSSSKRCFRLSSKNSLWVVLCESNIMARFLAKVSVVWLLLTPFIPVKGFGGACRSLGALSCLLLFYGMSSQHCTVCQAWIFPASGCLVHAIVAYRLFFAIPSYKF